MKLFEMCKERSVSWIEGSSIVLVAFDLNLIGVFEDLIYGVYLFREVILKMLETDNLSRLLGK
jgi:hypothetical protein